MRLILVKPTNATRRLDSTGDGGHAPSGGPATKAPDGMRDRCSGTSGEASSSPQETSLCGASSSPCQRSIGVSPPRDSVQTSPMNPRNLTLSQLSDQDWLLLCGQVSGVGGDSPPPEAAGSSVGRPAQRDRCGCSCPDAHQPPTASTLHPLAKRVQQDCLSRAANKKSLPSSPHTQPLPQSTCQVLPQPANHRDLLKPSLPPEDFLLHCSDQECQRKLFQQQPCNHFQLKDGNQATLLNIPLNSIQCVETNPKLHRQPPPADFNWRELFGKEPLLVGQKADSMSADPTCRSPGDPSVVLKCRHLPCNPLTPRAQRPSPPASNTSLQSFCSSLENQDVGTKRARQRQSQVPNLLWMLLLPDLWWEVTPPPPMYQILWGCFCHVSIVTQLP